MDAIFNVNCMVEFESYQAMSIIWMVSQYVLPLPATVTL